MNDNLPEFTIMYYLHLRFLFLAKQNTFIYCSNNFEAHITQFWINRHFNMEVKNLHEAHIWYRMVRFAVFQG